MNVDQTFGAKLRSLREKADLSLRELAAAVDVSAPFLSDVELGRRFPSDEILTKLAQRLRVSPKELKDHDPRESMVELKRFAETNPSLGFAFRSLVDHMKQGAISPEMAAAKIRSALDRK
jgi:transcriptional regulator with XRE-family HTH domain